MSESDEEQTRRLLPEPRSSQPPPASSQPSQRSQASTKTHVPGNLHIYPEAQTVTLDDRVGDVDVQFITRSSQGRGDGGNDDDDDYVDDEDSDEAEDEYASEGEEEWDDALLDVSTWPEEVQIIHGLIDPGPAPPQPITPSSQPIPLRGEYSDLAPIIPPAYPALDRNARGPGEKPDNFDDNEVSWRALVTAEDVDLIKALPRLNKADLPPEERDELIRESTRLCLSISRVCLYKNIKENERYMVNTRLGEKLWPAHWNTLLGVLQESKAQRYPSYQHMPLIPTRVAILDSSRVSSQHKHRAPRNV